MESSFVSLRPTRKDLSNNDRLLIFKRQKYIKDRLIQQEREKLLRRYPELRSSETKEPQSPVKPSLNSRERFEHFKSSELRLIEASEEELKRRMETSEERQPSQTTRRPKKAKYMKRWNDEGGRYIDAGGSCNTTQKRLYSLRRKQT